MFIAKLFGPLRANTGGSCTQFEQVLEERGAVVQGQLRHARIAWTEHNRCFSNPKSMGMGQGDEGAKEGVPRHVQMFRTEFAGHLSADHPETGGGILHAAGTGDDLK